jgi:hypothetical protein
MLIAFCSHQRLISIDEPNAAWFDSLVLAKWLFHSNASDPDQSMSERTRSWCR